MATARQVAFEALRKIERDGAYSNLAIDAALNKYKLSSLDSAFVSAAVHTVLERKITIDYNLSLYLSKPIEKLKPELLVILRLGASQLLFMDKVPASAAVNESVKLAKTGGCAYASGLVNAVLRKIAQGGVHLPEKDKDAVRFFSVKYSFAEWIVRLWIDSYGEETAEKIMQASFGAGDTVIRVNTLKTTAELLKKRLEEEAGEVREANIENALIISRQGAVEKLPSFTEGLFHVQDTASQICCRALCAQAGDRVLDICCAPGGKAFTTAQHMENTGEICGFDVYQQRVGLIDSGAQRLGINIIKTDVNDAVVFNPSLGVFDRVLCDVPCSGLGVASKKPEIRYKEKSDVDKLPDMQYNIVSVASRYTTVGGRLIYSTCTLNKHENEEVCRRFLNEHPDFEAVEALPDEIAERYIERQSDENNNCFLTLLPHISHSDGFFVAAFTRKE